MPEAQRTYELAHTVHAPHGSLLLSCEVTELGGRQVRIVVRTPPHMQRPSRVEPRLEPAMSHRVVIHVVALTLALAAAASV